VLEGWFSLEAACEICVADPTIGGFTWLGLLDPPEEQLIYVYFKGLGYRMNDDHEWCSKVKLALTGGTSQGLECLPGALLAGSDIIEGYYTLDSACDTLRSDPRIGGFCWSGREDDAGRVYCHFKPGGHPSNEDPEWTRIIKTS
jgi:hypothetical protein